MIFYLNKKLQSCFANVHFFLYLPYKSLALKLSDLTFCLDHTCINLEKNTVNYDYMTRELIINTSFTRQVQHSHL